MTQKYNPKSHSQSMRKRASARRCAHRKYSQSNERVKSPETSNPALAEMDKSVDHIYDEIQKHQNQLWQKEAEHQSEKKRHIHVASNSNKSKQNSLAFHKGSASHHIQWPKTYAGIHNMTSKYWTRSDSSGNNGKSKLKSPKIRPRKRKLQHSPKGATGKPRPRKKQMKKDVKKINHAPAEVRRLQKASPNGHMTVDQVPMTVHGNPRSALSSPRNTPKKKRTTKHRRVKSSAAKLESANKPQMQKKDSGSKQTPRRGASTRIPSTYEKRMRIFEQNKAEYLAARKLLDYGRKVSNSGKKRKAFQIFEKSLEIYKKLGDRGGQIMAHQALDELDIGVA